MFQCRRSWHSALGPRTDGVHDCRLTARSAARVHERTSQARKRASVTKLMSRMPGAKPPICGDIAGHVELVRAPAQAFARQTLRPARHSPQVAAIHDSTGSVGHRRYTERCRLYANHSERLRPLAGYDEHVCIPAAQAPLSINPTGEAGGNAQLRCQPPTAIELPAVASHGKDQPPISHAALAARSCLDRAYAALAGGESTEKRTRLGDSHADGGTGSGSRLTGGGSTRTARSSMPFWTYT